MHPSLGWRSILALVVALTVLTVGGCRRDVASTSETTERQPPPTVGTESPSAAVCPPTTPEAPAPVYYLVSSVAEQHALEATLRSTRPAAAPVPSACTTDRVIVVVPGMDVQRMLFPLTAVNQRRLEASLPPISVVDRRSQPAPDVSR